MIRNKKVVIFGGQGQLGKVFQKSFSAQNIDYASFDIDNCDITDFGKVKEVISVEAPDIIINCSAYNQVDEAELYPDKAYSVNSEAVQNICNICKERGILLVHYSSDYVFDGEKGKIYTEEDIPAPLNAYGRSKLAGEQYVQELLKDYLLFRVSWVFGRGEQNFLFKLSRWAEEKDELKVADDEVSVPCYTEDIARFTLFSLDKGLKGLYHLTNSGYTCRYKVAELFFELMGKKISVLPVAASFFKTQAVRPLFSAMSNKKIQAVLGSQIPSWQDGLKRFVEDYLQEESKS